MGASIDSSGGRRRAGARYRQRAEINVTPLVDVMLVLLIVFMITAPLLTVGVEVELPETEAPNLNAEREPLTITIQSDGAVYVQETETPLEELTPRLLAIAESGYAERIFIRGDASVDHGRVMTVMGHINAAGFTNIGLVTNPVPQQEQQQ